jgi:sugar/nucleoside kinase (ribokinase family)
MAVSGNRPDPSVDNGVSALVVLGNLIVDDIVFADGSARMAQPGGAVLYAALGARLWGQRVGCVSVQGDDYPVAMLERLQRRGVDLAGVRALGSAGVRAWLLYEGRQRHLVHRLGCPSHEAVSPVAADIPDAWRAARAFHLAPMPFDVQQNLVKAIATGTKAFVSVDPHLPIAADTLGHWRDMLSDVDAVFPGEDELIIDDACRNPERVLPQLVSGRLRFVVFKRGAQGGLLYDAHEQRFHSWTSRVSRVVDQTGAGDAFAAAFVSAQVDSLSVEASLQRAIVSASAAIESCGPESLLTMPTADARARLDEWFGIARPR